jgi:hypothetical protein
MVDALILCNTGDHRYQCSDQLAPYINSTDTGLRIQDWIRPSSHSQVLSAEGDRCCQERTLLALIESYDVCVWGLCVGCAWILC